MLLEGQVVVGQEWSLIFLGTAVARVSHKQLQCEPFHSQCEDVTGISCKPTHMQTVMTKKSHMVLSLGQPFGPVFQSHYYNRNRSCPKYLVVLLLG